MPLDIRNGLGPGAIVAMMEWLVKNVVGNGDAIDLSIAVNRRLEEFP